MLGIRLRVSHNSSRVSIKHDTTVTSYAAATQSVPAPSHASGDATQRSAGRSWLGLPCVSGNRPHFSRSLRKFASRRDPLRACMREPCLWPRDTGPLLQNDSAWSPRESMGASHAAHIVCGGNTNSQTSGNREGEDARVHRVISC
jgi:hypothetical protein